MMEDVKEEVKLLLERLLDDDFVPTSQPTSPLDQSNTKAFKQGSLVSLTQKFLKLIHDGNGIVDLNLVS